MRDARLVPRAAVPYLVVPDHTHHAGLAQLRREALDVLAAGYRSSGRTLLGVLAWAATAGGATLLAGLPWHAGTVAVTATLGALGAVLLAGGLWLAAGVLRAGRRITRAAAAWLRVPAAGATDADAAVLLGVVRWRVVLAGGAAAAAVALAVTLTYVLAQTGTVSSAYLGSGTTAAVTDATRALLVGALAVLAVTTAAAAVGTLGGVRTVAEAAWKRATVAGAAPTGPVAANGGRGVPVAGEGGHHVPVASPAVSAAGPAGHDAGQAGHDAGPAGHDAGPAGHDAGVPRVDGPPTVALDLSGLRASAEPQPVTADPTAGASVEVVLPGGRTLREGTTLLGRRPTPRPEDLVDDVVVLTDQTVTKTHATITVEDGAVRVVDRASTNGTLLEAPDGSLARCRAWQVTTVRAPAIIHLGRTRLHVRAAATRRPLEVA